MIPAAPCLPAVAPGAGWAVEGGGITVPAGLGQ